jgi:hypothetical protein
VVSEKTVIRETFPIMATLLQLSLFASGPAAAGCREGTYEYSQWREGTTVYHYCVASVACRDQLQAIDNNMRAMAARIAADRRAIKRWQGELPEYQRSLDEWIGMDEDARAVTRASARDAIIGAFLTRLQALARENGEIAQDESRALWEAYETTLLASSQFQELLREQGVAAAIIVKWKSRKQMLEAFEGVQKALTVSKDLRKQLWEAALIEVLKLGLHDPKLAVLADDIDFTATAITGNAIAWTARGAVERLLILGDQRLSALAALTKSYREHIDHQRKLRSNYASVLRGENVCI